MREGGEEEDSSHRVNDSKAKRLRASPGRKSLSFIRTADQRKGKALRAQIASVGQITGPEQRRKPVNQEERTVVCRSHQGCRNLSGALWVWKDLLSGGSPPVSSPTPPQKARVCLDYLS